MAITKMFRDRVVSLEQTQELGEKHLELLTALAVEALPGYVRTDSVLEHETDLFCLVVADETGSTKRISFTRMVLSEANRIPAVAENPHAPVRERFVELIRSQAERAEIFVGLRDLLTEEERVEASEIEEEWRKKNEALLAAQRAEEERRAKEKKRQKQIEEQRRAEDRRRRGEKLPQGAQAQRQGGGARQGQGQPGARHGQGQGQGPGQGQGQGQGRRRGRGGDGRGREQGSGRPQAVPGAHVHGGESPAGPSSAEAHATPDAGHTQGAPQPQGQGPGRRGPHPGRGPQGRDGRQQQPQGGRGGERRPDRSGEPRRPSPAPPSAGLPGDAAAPRAASPAESEGFEGDAAGESTAQGAGAGRAGGGRRRRRRRGGRGSGAPQQGHEPGGAPPS